MQKAELEGVALGLVREYLHSKGYKRALAALSEDLVVKPAPTTRAALAKQLGLNRELQLNKQRDDPFGTLVEIMADMFTKQSLSAPQDDESPPVAKPAAAPVPALTPVSKPASAAGGWASGAPLEPRSKLNPLAAPKSLARDYPDNVPRTSSGGRRPAASQTFEELEELEVESEPSANYAAKARPGASALAAPSAGVRGLAPVRGTPISAAEALLIRQLVFGAETPLGTFPPSWKQGFYFKTGDAVKNTPSLSSGLVQRAGGPCGILAAVQAHILKQFLFGTTFAGRQQPPSLKLLQPSAAAQKEAVINALTAMLWQAGQGNGGARVAVKGRGGGVAATREYRPDGITESLEIFHCLTPDETRTVVTANIATFMAKDDWGIVYFLYSVMLSRGLANIIKDKDEEISTMIGKHGYCTQEMVNLCLIGIAVSNVFDGDKSLDGTVFRGVKSRSELGYLSLFEHYNNLEVGHYYKTPEYPIWIVCSESHYTTFFFLSRSQPAGPTFDLYYYDQQANQEEEIRLTIDLSQSTPAPRDQIEPPLNDVIRTKWGKHARVNWNGVEPIL